MQRRYAEYGPAGRWRRIRVRMFRSVQLNVVGWAAVAALCLAGAGLGYAGGRLAGLPPGVGVAGGAAAVLALLVVLDRRRFR